MPEWAIPIQEDEVDQIGPPVYWVVLPTDTYSSCDLIGPEHPTHKNPGETQGNDQVIRPAGGESVPKMTSSISL